MCITSVQLLLCILFSIFHYFLSLRMSGTVCRPSLNEYVAFCDVISPAVTSHEGSIPVIHRCFGKCAGWLRATAGRVRCAACHQEFDVEQFVCHSHGLQESRTCHWGFDSANWRRYLQLTGDVADDERLQEMLDQFKQHLTDCNSAPPRKRPDQVTH